MIFTIFLWLLVWAAMYSGIENIRALQFFTDKLTVFQGIRALLPILAIYLCIMKAFFSRSLKVPSLKTAPGLFFYYCLIGIIASLKSTDILASIYYGFIYLSANLVILNLMNNKNPVNNAGAISRVNFIFFMISIVCFLPQALGVGLGVLNDLPFGLGAVNRNGIARYALVVIIIAFIHLINARKFRSYLYIFLLAPALFILAQSQSRTALLGLAVTLVLVFYLKGMNWRLFILSPIFVYIIWLSGFKWRAQEVFVSMFSLTGRELTWERALELIKLSPIYGWGFYADRLLLDFEHIHNSYIHALVQSGIVGGIFFSGAVVSIWWFIFKHNLFRLVRKSQDSDKTLIIESIALVGFLTARSFFESTAAFYGVDLLLFLPAVCFIYLWTKQAEGSKVGIKK